MSLFVFEVEMASDIFAWLTFFPLALTFELVMNYSASLRVCPQAVHFRNVTPVVPSDPIAIVQVSHVTLLHSGKCREQLGRSSTLNLPNPRQQFHGGNWRKLQVSFLEHGSGQALLCICIFCNTFPLIFSELTQAMLRIWGRNS